MVEKIMRAYSLLATLFVLILASSNGALAADTPDVTDNAANCAVLAASPPNDTSTDRFMREWCQRNSPTKTIAAETAASPPITVPSPAPAAVRPSYSTDDSADQLNSSRLPPGYHCHMLKFGERICHGGLD